MDLISQLQGMGLTLPTPAYFTGAIVFGLIGMAAYGRGKKAARPHLTWTGLALMVYPYAIEQTLLLWLLGVALTGWVWVKWTD